MPRNSYGNEGDLDTYADEDLGEHESPEELDDYEDEDDLRHCPACQAEVYDLSEQCPVCGEYITRASDWRTGRPLWFMALGGLGILATIAMSCFWF